MSEIKLYSYWRSSAAFRVRIALHLKHLRFETIPVNLISQDGGQQHSADYQQVNPQELVPTLIDGGRVIRQSLAIIEYLDESYDGARLLPSTARERARARGLAQLIACDIHPLNNLRVLQYLEHEDHMPQIERERWVQHWIKLGFRAYEDMLTSNPSTGEYSEGDIPSIADCCLVPQVFNAQRFGIDMKAFPEIMRITANCLKLPEFDAARPERQPDAPKG